MSGVLSTKEASPQTLGFGSSLPLPALRIIVGRFHGIAGDERAINDKSNYHRDHAESDEHDYAGRRRVQSDRE